MDRRTAATAVLALLAVLALGVAAATLDSATTTETRSDGFGGGSATGESGFGDSEGAVDLGGRPNETETNVAVRVCVTFLTEPSVVTVLGLAVVAFLLAMYRTTGSWVLSGMFVGAALFPFGVLYLALISCGGSPTSVALGLASRARNNSSILPSGGGEAGAAGAGQAVSAPTALVGILLLVAIAGSVLLLFVSTGDDDEELAEEAPEPRTPERRRAVGAAAGDAADRLEGGAALENEVFRAWRELTAALEVDEPASTTPGEFADAAVAAGMDPADVRALTEAFEAVRYGGEPATEAREREAVAALRRIERRYAADADAAADEDIDPERLDTEGFEAGGSDASDALGDDDPTGDDDESNDDESPDGAGGGRR